MKINADLPLPATQRAEASRTEEDKTFGLGAIIRQVRLRRELTHQELADMVGLTRTSITNIENGKQSLQLSTLIGLAEALQMEVEVNLKPKEGLQG
jgi:transcriptional regulator with XRE-family HTH domain